MLRDVFPFLLDEGEFIESATIWETSRICAVAADGQPERSKNGVNLALGELLAGIGEVAIIAGLTQIVSVFDARIYSVLKAAGCNPQIIGRPRRIGDTMSYAGLFDTGEGPLQSIRNAVGIEGSVLEPRQKEQAPQPKNSLSRRNAIFAGVAKHAGEFFNFFAAQSIARLRYKAVSFLASSITSETMASRRAGFLTPMNARCRRSP